MDRPPRVKLAPPDAGRGLLPARRIGCCLILMLAWTSVGRAQIKLDSAETSAASAVDPVAFPAASADPSGPTTDATLKDDPVTDWPAWFRPERLGSSVQLVTTMTVLGLVPAVLLMTTSYVRITIVLTLLRQAFGTQQLLPAQVTTALAMFCTALIMWPTWTAVYEQGVQPWLAAEGSVDWQATWETGIEPVRTFMVRQIDLQGNSDDVHLFLRRIASQEDYPASYAEVPLQALLPAFLLSELKTAFVIGFQIYLPFLVIDLVVAAVTTSMGMFMLPPAMVSLPLKLLMFVMVDGWHLIVEMLLQSFQ